MATYSLHRHFNPTGERAEQDERTPRLSSQKQKWRRHPTTRRTHRSGVILCHHISQSSKTPRQNCASILSDRKEEMKESHRIISLTVKCHQIEASWQKKKNWFHHQVRRTSISCAAHTPPSVNALALVLSTGYLFRTYFFIDRFHFWLCFCPDSVQF